jgi:hypothetical protein
MKNPVVDSLPNSTKFYKELTLILLKISMKQKGEKHYQTHSMKPLIPKPDKDTTK